MNKLGNFFYSGFGVEKIDMAKAIYFYEKAAEMDDSDALINLGFVYNCLIIKFKKGLIRNRQ